MIPGHLPFVQSDMTAACYVDDVIQSTSLSFLDSFKEDAVFQQFILSEKLSRQYFVYLQSRYKRLAFFFPFVIFFPFCHSFSFLAKICNDTIRDIDIFLLINSMIKFQFLH